MWANAQRNQVKICTIEICDFHTDYDYVIIK